MNKNILFLGTIVLAIVFGFVISLFARGYRFNLQSGKVQEHGILVLKSHPDPAEIYLDGELETATNATLNLEPGEYEVEIRKEGYHSWKKRLQVNKEEVIEATAHLFRTAPNLSAITFTSSVNPVTSDDFTKLAYTVLPEADSNDTEGLWLIETINLPIGFSRDPRRITNGDLAGALLQFSPDSREILISLNEESFLIPTSEFTQESNRRSLTKTQLEELLEEWEQIRARSLTEELKLVPSELANLVSANATDMVFSPDQDMMLYRVTTDFTIPVNLIPPLPGASTQLQAREVKAGGIYIYDIKEDRNYLFTEDGQNITIGNKLSINRTETLNWFPTSRHIIHAQENNISITDYDGTNRTIVYQGPYIWPHVFPSTGIDRLVILTDLGAATNPANLYSLGIK